MLPSLENWKFFAKADKGKLKVVCDLGYQKLALDNQNDSVCNHKAGVESAVKCYEAISLFQCLYLCLTWVPLHAFACSCLHRQFGTEESLGSREQKVG